MRKIFSLFTAILFAASMVAADPVTVKSTFTKATAPAENAVTDLEGVVTWSIATEVGAGTPSYTTGKNNKIECLKFGSKAAEYFSKVTLSTNYYKDYNVKSVTLYVLNNGKKTGTLTVKQGETTIGTDSKEFGAAWTALTATGVTGNGGTLEVSYEVAQASFWSYIEVQYEISQGGGEPTLANGYYLVGDKYNWTPAAERILTVNPENASEYMVSATLAVDDSLKVVRVENDVITTWYPEGDNYVVDAAHAGEKTIYFRPDGQGGEGWHYGCIFVPANEPVVEDPDFYIAGTMTSWADNKIAVTGTSYKLNLEAGDYQLKVIVGEGEAAQWKGYDALTTVADGLTRGEGEAADNICFTLAEAGEVSVHYDGEFFFLIGNFYVAPVEVHYYFKNNWGGESWTWKEITNEEGYYMLGPVAVGGEGVNFHTAMTDDAPFITWAEISAFDASYEQAVIGAGDTVLFFFDPEEVNTYTGANGLSAQITYKYVAPEEPVYRLENGYYLFGSAQEWNVANLDAGDKFAVNPENNAEYVLTATLTEGQAFKVVYVENDAIKTYYPGGTDNNYAVDAAHAGVKDIYFRPDYQGGTDWYNSCIFVAPNSGTAIDKVAGEAKAVKILKNGMLIIEKNGVKYNVLGVRL